MLYLSVSGMNGGDPHGKNTKSKRNYKLLIDPAIKKGHQKIYRFDGTFPGVCFMKILFFFPSPIFAVSRMVVLGFSNLACIVFAATSSCPTRPTTSQSKTMDSHCRRTTITSIQGKHLFHKMTDS